MPAGDAQRRPSMTLVELSDLLGAAINLSKGAMQ